jgi:predicted HicB family RNase H-like nuclease
MIRKEEADRLLVRLPRDVKAWIQREAARNGASQNSEIIRSIRARMEPAAEAER